MTFAKRTSTTYKSRLCAAALAVIAVGMWSTATPAMAATVSDQDGYLVPPPPRQLYNQAAARNLPVAQTFTAGITGALTNVDLSLTKQGTGVGASVSIYKTTAGIPDCALATADIDPSQIPTSIIPIPTQHNGITFSAPAQVQAGTQYAIVVSSSSLPGNTMWWSGYSDGQYLGGTPFRVQNLGGPWVPLSGSVASGDFTFATSVDSSITGVSVCGSSGGGGAEIVDNTLWYQSYGRATAASECTSGYTGSWAEWANDNRGGYVCNRAVYSYHPQDDPKGVFFGTWRAE